MSEQRLFDENLTAEQGLVPIIKTMLIGVDPDEQEVRLDDTDWQNVIDAFGLIARLIKWDTDFPVNSHNGYAGLKELNLIIAEGKSIIGTSVDDL